MRTPTLECFYQFMNSNSRISGNKVMNVIGLYAKIKDFNAFFFSDLFNDLLKSLFNFTNENGLPSFRTPYQVVVNKIYLIARMFVFHNVDIIVYINKIVKRKMHKEKKMEMHKEAIHHHG
jgi:hypothetical protein